MGKPSVRSPGIGPSRSPHRRFTLRTGATIFKPTVGLHFGFSKGGAGSLCPGLKQLTAPEPAKRVWTLSAEQCETFQSIFLQMLNEHSSGRAHRESAASAWLQLLLVSVQRWADHAGDSLPAVPPRASTEVLRLWHLVNAAVSKPSDELQELYAAPNYDSARHGFRKTFGCSPREMLQRLRMAHAKNLLLESTLSIKEIATRVGYLQQHDFNRVFHRYAGMAPSKWRTNPLARSAGA